MKRQLFNEESFTVCIINIKLKPVKGKFLKIAQHTTYTYQGLALTNTFKAADTAKHSGHSTVFL